MVKPKKRSLLQESSPPALKISKEDGLPSFITERLTQMKRDILSHLEQSLPPSLNSAQQNFNSRLETMLQYYFKGGEMLRPTVALLVAAACNQKAIESDEITEAQYKLAMVGEMIHVAGLVHDDVIDEADTRQGQPSLNAFWGNKAAVLIGDLILTKTFQILATIDSTQISQLVNKIIEDTIQGEIMQVMSGDGSLEEQLAFDLERQSKNTASMFENLCRGMAILSGGSQYLQDAAAAYGQHLGLSYRIVDCILDCDPEKSEKGVGADLKQGLITIPVLLAAQTSPKLAKMIKRKFNKPANVEKALELIRESDGLDRARSLAREYSDKAVDETTTFSTDRRITDCLAYLAVAQLERRK